MNIKNLPLSLLQTAQHLVDTQAVLESCRDCGAVIGCCIHTDGDEISEDAASAPNVPDEDDPETELSGETEDVIINPEYKTFAPRRPF